MMRIVSLVLLACAGLLPAQDDRDRVTKTAAIWQTDCTPTDIQNLVNQGWRLTDIEIESSTTWEFTISAVPNSGSYSKGWWWVYGVTQAQLSATIASNNARIVDLEPYDDAGTTRFAAILIANTGADAKAWWWYTGQTSAQVGSNVSANNGRLTCFRRYSVGGVDRYATVMISNTGTDARSWGYLFGASAATIDSNVTQNGNRIYGIERVASDSFDVILVEHTNFGWWWYLDLTGPQVTELLQQNIGRLVDVERHATLLGTRYTAVMLDNANSLERTARNAFYTAAAGALGAYGCYLKEVNGAVLAEMRADTVFEPASTMKTLYHVHAMKQVQQGLSLSTLLNKPISCGVAGSNQTLQVTLSQMMENSDNMSTLAVSNYFGIGNIAATAGVLGMPSTHINFTIGCQAPTPGSAENQLTLRDLTALHEQVANGYLGSQRQNFYDLMANGLGFPSWGADSLDLRINLEAASRAWPNTLRNAFKDQIGLAYKPGGIGLSWQGVDHYYFAEGGWLRAPFKDAQGNLAPREYTFGVFNYDFHTQEVSGREAMCLAELELVWNRVRAAMVTWDNHVPGQITPLIGAGCAGSAGLPTHSVNGTPEMGGSVFYQLANAPAPSLCLTIFGFQNQTYNGLPLPLNLGIIGAPGCLLRIDAVVLEAGVATNGTFSRQLVFPWNPALIGAQLYSQYLVGDPPANAFGWTITNAVRTTLGGWL